MELRTAEKRDLNQIKKMYEEIVDHMNQQKIDIWNKNYPGDFFAGDIEHERLFILTEGDEIIAAALCENGDGGRSVPWSDPDAAALYMYRLGVRVKYAGQGMGSQMVACITEIARQKGAGYLRLFAVDRNKPAINLYLKNGFTQVDGIYEERITKVLLYEYAFEKKIASTT